MFQLLASKGLSGYIDGKIQKPEPESVKLKMIIDYSQSLSAVTNVI